MSAVTVIYALLFYAATAILVVGVARKITIYAHAATTENPHHPGADNAYRGVAADAARGHCVREPVQG